LQKVSERLVAAAVKKQGIVAYEDGERAAETGCYSESDAEAEQNENAFKGYVEALERAGGVFQQRVESCR